MNRNNNETKSSSDSVRLPMAGLCLGFLLNFSGWFIPAYAQDTSVKDLDFLIGTWEIEETIMPNSPKSYQEKGTRTCEYYLDGSYIKCEANTVISTSGKKRAYAYLINYDPAEKCFIATGVASDYPKHGSYRWYLNSEKKEVMCISPQDANGNQFFRSKMEFDKNRIIWRGYSSKYNSDKDWILVFEDIAQRLR